MVATDRLGEILDLETEKAVNEDKKINPKTLLGNIELKNIDFRYGSRQLILKNISMNIKTGEKIALVGESGSGTIRENLQFANEEATCEEIIDACKKAQIHDYINSTPTRYEKLLEEKGANLSGGQRQRLAIARALLKKPEILIMDEATSNLDTITEKAIENTIEECTKNVTTIIIAHRLSTIMKCDRIYVMDKGQVIEEGTHEDLLRLRGYYYKLWTGQTCRDLDEAAATLDGEKKMKYKIENLEDITDSREIMQSTPNGFMTYLIISLLSLVIVWSLFANSSELVTEDFKLEIDKASIKANSDGVINMLSELKIGDFIQNGTQIASIVPKDQLDYNVEVYINSQSFGEIKEGQDVILELASLPGQEYGYIKSNLKNISVDAKVNQEQGISYYTAICEIDKNSLVNKKGEEVSIKNGMIVEARIVNRRIPYFRYFLEKIDIID